jgi:phosphate transport system protein
VPPEPHTSKRFDEDLASLRGRILEMGSIAEYQIRYAIEGLRGSDPRHITKVIAEEVRVNAMEVEIDALLSKVLARRFPTAVDLRFVLAASKMVTDLERVGDEAKKIALTAQRLAERERLRHGYAEIGVVAQIVIDMLRRALDAFARLEDGDALAIQQQDETVDDHFHAILRQLLTYMIEDPRTISPAIELVFVAKSLERIGDHAKNISEYVVYVTRGHDVRHVSRDEMARTVGQ